VRYLVSYVSYRTIFSEKDKQLNSNVMPHTLGFIPEQLTRMHLLDRLISDMYTVLNSFAVPKQKKKNNAANVKLVEHCGNYIYHLLQV
jgi:hypothetical protein